MFQHSHLISALMVTLLTFFSGDLNANITTLNFDTATLVFNKCFINISIVLYQNMGNIFQSFCLNTLNFKSEYSILCLYWPETIFEECLTEAVIPSN